MELFATRTWRRVVMGFHAEKGPGTGSWLQVWVDGRRLMVDRDWRAAHGRARGGLIFSSKASAYLKFGIYGSTARFARNHYFANMVVATTRDAASRYRPGEPTHAAQRPSLQRSAAAPDPG